MSLRQVARRPDPPAPRDPACPSKHGLCHEPFRPPREHPPQSPGGKRDEFPTAPAQPGRGKDEFLR